MPSAKHNSTMQRATGLISSLLDVASSQDVPFCELQQLHSMHHGAIFAFSVSCFFPFYHIGVELQWPQCELTIAELIENVLIVLSNAHNIV